MAGNRKKGNLYLRVPITVQKKNVGKLLEVVPHSSKCVCGKHNNWCCGSQNGLQMELASSRRNSTIKSNNSTIVDNIRMLLKIVVNNQITRLPSNCELNFKELERSRCIYHEQKIKKFALISSCSCSKTYSIFLDGATKSHFVVETSSTISATVTTSSSASVSTMWSPSLVNLTILEAVFEQVSKYVSLISSNITFLSYTKTDF